ncbi:MAG TPA: TonB-dependent receptor [Pyrinomonadaceae bacterium]|jgi:iron complex outermembrane receptor protein/outer membrane receptor for ferrienterochelin and colicins|nr:TonB-dependent receptor [Pyrinomonadaceae bacterium]
MKYIFLLAIILLSASAAFAHNTFKAVIKNDETKAPVAGAEVSLKGNKPALATNAEGRVELKDIPDGEQTIMIFAAGYETMSLTLTFPLTDQTEHEIFIKAVHSGEEVIVSSTRTGREIDDVPTRVEAIDEEEVDEKINMRPANVSMVLHESTGIQVQQTSATSATQSIRIQGLDGRYTQLLKDGFPAFGGFSGSLSILEIPPLDLKQVEIIKGPAATFYGAGAIAGVVNFISKQPEEKPVTSFIFNQTSALGTDVSIFHTRKFAKFGYSLLGSMNYQKEYDVDDDDFTELPRTHSFNVNPKMFFYLSERTRLVVGNSLSVQKRKGGDVFAIRGPTDNVGNFHRYFENNDSFRNITTLNFEHEFSDGRKFTARQGLAFFSREIDIPGYNFGGDQVNSYTDVTYFYPVKKHVLVFGVNAVYDKFAENSAPVNAANPFKRNETRTTVGGYFQDSFDINEKLSLEAGMRLDVVRDYGVFALPRVSLLYRFTGDLTTRVAFGLGYKTPSVFTEEAETLLFQNVLPVGSTLEAERSHGGTFDINYKGAIGEKFTYALNQMFFYTEIRRPLVLVPAAGNTFRFVNASRPVQSSGFETNLRLGYGIMKVFAGYTFTHARAKYLTGDQTVRLLPKSKINSALIFEKEANFKTGLEAYFSSRQRLTGGQTTGRVFEVGLFAEKTFGKISVFINAENLTDVRQGRYGQVVFPPHQSPTFAEIYTHTEGRTFNGGFKIRM